MNTIQAYVWYLCMLSTVLGLEMSMDLNPETCTEDAQCCVLTCEEEYIPDTTNKSAIVLPPLSISSMKIYRSDQSTSTDDIKTDPNKDDFILAITTDKPKLSAEDDRVKVEGTLTAIKASMVLEMKKESDCLASYSCELGAEDAAGNEVPQVCRVQQRPKDNKQQELMAKLLSSIQEQLAASNEKLSTLENRLLEGQTALQTDLVAVKEDLVELKSDVKKEHEESRNEPTDRTVRQDQNQGTCENLYRSLDTFLNSEQKTGSNCCCAEGGGMSKEMLQDTLADLFDHSRCKQRSDPSTGSFYPYYVVEPSVQSGFDFRYRCDAATDGGGWIVIQRRSSGDLDFYRDWDDYREGFGNLDDEFWLGNRYINYIVGSGTTYELRVDLGFNGTLAFATYDSFSIDDESNNYALHVAGFNGTLGDGLWYHNGEQFTTRDRDNDRSPLTNCAEDNTAAWWFKACYDSNLNGNWSGWKGKAARWQGFSGNNPVTFSEMKVRPLRDGQGEKETPLLE